MKWLAPFLLLSAALRADVSLAPLFQDGAVLQRDKPLAVWGTAAAGEQVSVTLGRDRATTAADSSGRWRVALAARPASSVPSQLVVEGRNRVVVSNVVVGDVWLCSGQSNMGMTVRSVRDAEREIAAADYPLIRQFRVKSAFSETPQASLQGSWHPCTPETVLTFTATGYFFARQLWRELGVPIGIVNSSYGNTPISSWREPSAIADEPEVRRWWTLQSRSTPAPRPHRPPSSCYNGMIHALAPYTLRGVLWYQGEGDATEKAILAPIYRQQLAGLITEWRRRFEAPDLPVFWVQLAGFVAGDRAWTEIRAAQTATLAVPHTGQAVALDIGDADDIHAKNKQAVGDRLARLALHRVHGLPVEDMGPEPQSVTLEGETVRIRFSPAGGALGAEGNLASAFELAGPSGRFVAVREARIDGDDVILRSHDVSRPVTVRFAWQNVPTGFLKNAAGLPAGPFVRPVSP